MIRESALTHEAAIAAAIQEAVASDPITAPHGIGVAVVGTTVSLRGHVPSPGAKRRAERLARGVGGVMDVTNELEITPGSALDAPALGLSLMAADGAGAHAGSGAGVGGLAAAQAVGAAGAGPFGRQDRPGATETEPMNAWEG
jgi:hypothetical protein